MNQDLSRLQQAGLPTVQTLNVIGVFDDDEHATLAEQALEQAGFGRDDISALAMPPGSAPRMSAEEANVRQGMRSGAKVGVLLGGLTTVALVLPGVGTLLAAGPIAAIISGSLVGGSLGGLAGSFAGLGMTSDQAQEYEAMVRSGAEVIAVRTANSESAAAAAQILNQHGAHHVVTQHEHL